LQFPFWRIGTIQWNILGKNFMQIR
jgi:hypothetical protein